MSRYLLDTNIVSEATRPTPSTRVTEWLSRVLDTELFISALTIAEIRRGILENDAGRKRRLLERWFEGPEGPSALFRNRVLSFDEAAAMEWARIMAEGTALGRPRSAIDMVIAASAAVHDCVVVTLNARHFRDVVELVDLGLDRKRFD